MMYYKISVCVSVHNTAKYLPRCLDCLVNQTLSPIEIVLVNNGSTDNSEEIMYQYKSKYPDFAINIFKQEDRGLAQGRQTGIDNAHGDYIAFLDADDLVCHDAYEKLYNYAYANDLDIVECQTTRDNKIIESRYEGIKDASAVLRDYLSGFGMPIMLWLRIYKKSLFNIKKLPKLYTNNEDGFAFPCLLCDANKIGYIKEVLHTYSIDNENAVMLSPSETDDQKIKIFERKKVALNQVPFVKEYLEEAGKLMEYEAELGIYTKNAITNFIFSDYGDVSCINPIITVVEFFKFKDHRELNRYLKKQGKIQNFVDCCIRLFGLIFTYKIWLFKNRRPHP